MGRGPVVAMETPPGSGHTGLRVDVYSDHVTRPLRRVGTGAHHTPAEGGLPPCSLPAWPVWQVGLLKGSREEREAPAFYSLRAPHASSVHGPLAPPSRLFFFPNQMSVFKILENIFEAIKKN